jgi:hypothetical protein
MKITVKRLRRMIREAMLVEKHPGGPRTDVGALRQLEPNSFVMKVKSVMADHEGDVHKAAEDLEVAPRTLYYYLDDESALNNVETSEDKEEAKEEKK